MNRPVYRGAAFAATARVLLVVAALFASGCGGGNNVETVTGEGGDDGSGDATSDGGDGSTVPPPDAGSDRSMSSDGGHDAADAAQDQSTTDAPSDRTAVDAPSDQSTTDAPGDQSTVDAPPETSGMDAPADVVTGCNAVTCPTGCCSGTTCTTPSTSACGTAGATCTACGSTADGCSALGTCTCGGGNACGSGQVCSGGQCVCDATSCPTGCCQGNICQPGTDPNACGAAGGTCAMCPTGETCGNGSCSGCNASSCPNGCCSGSTCTMPSSMACGTAGATCTNCGSKADGCSASGTCSCGGGAACGSGQACSGGKCVCDAASCPTGCCSGNTCTTPSAMACGTGGASCTSCGTTGDGCSMTGSCTCGGGAACGTGQACSGGKCVCDAASCPSGCCQGNTCQPGNTTAACGASGGTCQMCATGDTCTTGMCVAPPPVCGDGILETGEQCDDGNLVNLDGCNSTCNFEQVTRATRIVLQWAHDTFCTKDVLLEAIKDPFLANVHSTLQGDLDTDVTNGTDNLVLEYFAITDLTGQAGTASVGSYNATLTNAYTGTFTGNSDLDWWYTLDTTTAGGTPLFTPNSKESAGTFAGGVLSASGGHVLVSAFGTSLLDLASIKLQLPIASPATKPTASTGAPPGHLASEHVASTLTSFNTAGLTNTSPTGLLCGNTTAASLAGTAVPPQLQTNCTQNFGATNNMLDVFVEGCTANIVGTIISPVQPDQVNPDAPAAGAGGNYTFQLTGNHVTGCKDKNGTAVTPYTNCLAPAAYSTYLKFAADRVILKHP
ncbi:MAG TPA: hypothetical protein VF765_28235 [Polyangiaceae bacterium]